MPKLRSLELTVTTDSNGDAVATLKPSTGQWLVGYVVALVYTKDDYTDGVDFDVATSRLGLVVLSQDDVNASQAWLPRYQVSTNDGVDAVLTSGNEPYLDKIPLAAEAITITVGSGGDTKSGIFTLVYEDWS